MTKRSAGSTSKQKATRKYSRSLQSRSPKVATVTYEQLSFDLGKWGAPEEIVPLDPVDGCDSNLTEPNVAEDNAFDPYPIIAQP